MDRHHSHACRSIFYLILLDLRQQPRPAAPAWSVKTGALQELMFLHSDESNDFAYTTQVDSDDEDGDHRSILNENNESGGGKR